MNIYNKTRWVLFIRIQIQLNIYKMELKIKEKYLGKVIHKGIQVYTLTETLTQRELLHIKNMISQEYVEEIVEKVEVIEVKQEKKDKKNVINNKQEQSEHSERNA